MTKKLDLGCNLLYLNFSRGSMPAYVRFSDCYSIQRPWPRNPQWKILESPLLVISNFQYLRPLFWQAHSYTKPKSKTYYCTFASAIVRKLSVSRFNNMNFVSGNWSSISRDSIALMIANAMYLFYGVKNLCAQIYGHAWHRTFILVCICESAYFHHISSWKRAF